VAITLVGFTSGAINNGNDVTLSMPGGTQDGDVVIVWGGHFNRAGSGVGVSTSGFESLLQHTAADPFFDVSWKRLGGSPSDGTITCRGSGNAADAAAYGLYVLRGVDATGGSPASILDSSIQTAGPTTSTNPDCPPAIVRTDGAWVLALAFSGVNDATITAPLSNQVSANANDTNPATIGGCTTESSPGSPETFNPGSYTSWSSGVWYAVTLVIKPAANVVSTTGDAAVTEDSDTVSASASIVAQAEILRISWAQLEIPEAAPIAATLSASEDADTLSSSASVSGGAEILRISWAQLELPEAAPAEEGDPSLEADAIRLPKELLR
jgi:hypothetical protein